MQVVAQRYSEAPSARGRCFSIPSLLIGCQHHLHFKGVDRHLAITACITCTLPCPHSPVPRPYNPLRGYLGQSPSPIVFSASLAQAEVEG